MFHIRKNVVPISNLVLKNGRRVRLYSRSRDSKNLDSYKIVNSDVIEETRNARLESSPNWELFGSRGQRFLLPGSVGPAWHEQASMVPVDGFKSPIGRQPHLDFEALECTAQECPVLLRQSIKELFPNSDAASLQVTVVTLTRKKIAWTKRQRNKDAEYHAKTFMWAAQEICMKLKAAGYWADFINPFSGRPYLGPLHKTSLYEADERFRCIGFEIESLGGCKVIQSKKGSTFIGSLFTNAPPSTTFLMDLLDE